MNQTQDTSNNFTKNTFDKIRNIITYPDNNYAIIIGVVIFFISLIIFFTIIKSNNTVINFVASAFLGFIASRIFYKIQLSILNPKLTSVILFSNIYG